MKLEKVSRVLSLVVAGAMVLAMAPAAFAASDHIDQIGVDNGNGTCSYVSTKDGTVIDTMPHVYYDGETKCARCGAEKPVSVCDHEHQHAVDNGDGTCSYVCDNEDCKAVIRTQAHVYYDGETKCARCGAVKSYTPIDATHHHVHLVYEDGTVYDADVDCVFETGTCICGNTCNHVGVQKVVDNGDGTHNIVCPTCGEVLGTAKHVYGEDGKGTCACGAEFTCDHMGQHFKFVANNNGTHNVLCADCDAVVSENVPCTYVDGKCEQCGAAQPAPEPTPDPEPTPAPSVGPVATTIGLGTCLLILGGLILGFLGL